LQFVSALQDTLSGVCRPNAELLNVTKYGNTVLGDGMADARNDGIVGEMFAFVQHIDRTLADHQ
jgi:hypothetical protein